MYLLMWNHQPYQGVFIKLHFSKRRRREMTQVAALRPSLLLFILLLVVGGAEMQVVCFACYGNSTTSGKMCSIDSLCSGTSCYLNINPSGSWSAGCSSIATQTALDCTITSDGSDLTECGCTADFCNKFEDVNYTAHAKWPSRAPFTTLQLASAVGELITCQECGNLTINGLVKDIPCDEQHLCQGNYCVTKRGQTPHSYCGSNWEGTGTAACFKRPGEDEQCVCPQQMCNAVLPTEKTTSPKPATAVQSTQPTSSLLTTILSTVATPGQDPATATTTKPLVKRCKSNIKFSPNAQAVLMGEKLKNIISGGFGTSGPLQGFQDDIDTHICAYSES